MPELPEVHTTVTGLQKSLPSLSFISVWTDMWSSSKLAKNTIKEKTYFQYFKKYLLNQKIIAVRRRAKYILIDLENDFTVIIHMKMTGHLMVGEWVMKQKKWIPRDKLSPLTDPYNRHIHVLFTLSNKKQLAFCDSRKFGTIVIEKTNTLQRGRLSHLGPEPLLKEFTQKIFEKQIMKSPRRAIKTVLMDQTIVAGIGNIYSDEMLHRAHIIPTRTPQSLTNNEIKLLYKAMKEVLRKGINFGGDSTSDYRNINGERGAFHAKHRVYLRTKQLCLSPKCSGKIMKQTIGGRSAHFCDICQH